MKYFRLSWLGIHHQFLKDLAAPLLDFFVQTVKLELDFVIAQSLFFLRTHCNLRWTRNLSIILILLFYNDTICLDQIKVLIAWVELFSVGARWWWKKRFQQLFATWREKTEIHCIFKINVLALKAHFLSQQINLPYLNVSENYPF